MFRQISRRIAITLLGVAGSIGKASAAVYQGTLSGGGVEGSGLLGSGGTDGGGYDILSFTGSVAGSPVTLFGGQPGPLGMPSPDNGVYYNNILYPALNSGSPKCAGGN